MAPRLPKPGGDAGNWGEILNDFLRQEHHDDGSLKKAADIATKADAAAVYSRTEADTLLAAKVGPAELAAIETNLIQLNNQSLDVHAHGAVGGGLGTTVAAAGEDISAIRTETGQDWLQTSDSMDLVAFYRAQVAAESTRRTIRFPRDAYVFTGPAFLHAGVNVDLGGSTVTSTNTNASRFTRANRVFLLGILAREDFARFGAQGWEQTAADLAIDATTIANLTGTVPSIGDTLLIRTTTASGTLPDYTTFNEVLGVVGATVTLRYPIERAMVDPIVINYSTITTLKSTLAGTGEPHRYYCCAHASLKNGTLVATDGPAFEPNGTLDCDIDVQINAPNGQAMYGNAFNRSRARVRGTFGGPKGAVEVGVGWALSTVEVDVAYSGIDTDSAGSVSGNYALVQMGENAERVTVRGQVDGGSKPSSHGVTFPTANRCTVDLQLVGRGITDQAVVFPSNAGIGNRVGGRYEISPIADYYARWTAGTGSDNWLEGASFSGDQSTLYSLWFEGSNLGGARGVDCPEGQLRFTSGTSGNIVESSMIREGLQAAGKHGNQVDIKQALGSWPERDVTVAYNVNTAFLNREAWGRTVTNEGGTFLRTFTLPVSEAGMSMKFYRAASFAMQIDPAGTETVGTGGAGKYLELGSDKAWVELRCLVAGHWVVATTTGTIAFEP